MIVLRGNFARERELCLEPDKIVAILNMAALDKMHQVRADSRHFAHIKCVANLNSRIVVFVVEIVAIITIIIISVA